MINVKTRLLTTLLLTNGMQMTCLAAAPTSGNGHFAVVESSTLGANNLQQAHRNRPTSGHRSYADLVLSHVGDLKLSDDQVGKITRIQQDTRKKLEEIGAKVRDTRHDTQLGFVSPSVEESVVRSAAEAHSAAFLELVDTALKARNAINTVLSADQLQKLKTLKN